ncbi:MAG: DUF998 domain-containing protein, partial [Saprospiraceae bacterium]|nr:DUF998 domain-containing protein [Saprospiraceae bacterium]
MLAGVLIAVFGTTLFRKLTGGALARIGAFLVLLFGVGMVVVGFFSCEQNCMNRGSVEGALHDNISAAMFLAAIIGLILIGTSLRRTSATRMHGSYALLSGIGMAVALALMIQSFESQQLTGLWQRLYLAILFVWMALTGFRLFHSRARS